MIEAQTRPDTEEAIGPYRWVRPEVRDRVHEALVLGRDHSFVMDEIKDFYIEEVFGIAQDLTDKVIDRITLAQKIQEDLNSTRGTQDFSRKSLNRALEIRSDQIIALSDEADEATNRARLLDESRDSRLISHRTLEEALVGKVKGHFLAITVGAETSGTLDHDDLSWEDARAIFNKYADVIDERQVVVDNRYKGIRLFRRYKTQSAQEAEHGTSASLKEKVAEILQ